MDNNKNKTKAQLRDDKKELEHCNNVLSDDVDKFSELIEKISWSLNNAFYNGQSDKKVIMGDDIEPAVDRMIEINKKLKEEIEKLKDRNLYKKLRIEIELRQKLISNVPSDVLMMYVPDSDED